MHNDLITVIVPVYKVEKYLRACLDSIIGQTYQNLEIIVIDDGSPDNCGSICDEYARQDSRVRVIHQENGGLSRARNTGIKHAHGEYLSFIDSDDFVSEYFIEMLYSAVIKTGAFVASTEYDINRFIDGEENSVKFATNANDYSLQKLSIHNALELMLYQQIPSGAPFRLYKKELFDDLRFPEGWIFEDVATVHKAFIKSNSIALLEASIYAYRLRPEGIVKSKFTQAKMVVVPITRNLYKEIMDFDNSLRYAVASRAFAQNYHVFLQIPYSDKKDLTAIWTEMKKYRSSVLHDHSKFVRKKNKIGALSSLLGMNASYWLGQLYLKVR